METKVNLNRIVRTKDVIGNKVFNTEGPLGKIEEIVLDKVEGTVNYVVLSFGGILGLGEKLFTIPWKKISYDKAQGGFFLNISKQQLKDAPGFDKNSWPDMDQQDWTASISDFYH